MNGSDNRLCVDLNSDLGEAFGRWPLGDDEGVLSIVTSANVACGMHAGDPCVMRKTIELAKSHGVAVGAHPGYPDLQGFGRRAMALSADEIYAFVQYQVAAALGMCRAQGVTLQHVKPHGALYNRSAVDEATADAIARAVADLDSELILVGLAGSVSIQAAQDHGLPVAQEFFADRGYTASGTLVPRNEPGAMVKDPHIAAARVIRAISTGEVEAVDGTTVACACDTVCVHGDNPQALAFARVIRAELTEQGTEVCSLHMCAMNKPPSPVHASKAAKTQRQKLQQR